jgi:hypothetical protein
MHHIMRRLPFELIGSLEMHDVHDIPLAEVLALSLQRDPTITNFIQAFFFLDCSVAHISTYLTRRTKR